MHTKKTQQEAGNPGSARGFSLIEVLVALIVMSVGMLGIAGLYVHGLQAGRTSLFRHHAVNLAGDVADRIRANPYAGIAYTASAGADNGCIAGGTDCTPGEMASSDIDLWQEQANATLPDGAVTVAYSDAAVPSVYTVTVAWSEPGQNPAPSYQVRFPIFEMPL